MADKTHAERFAAAVDELKKLESEGCVLTGVNFKRLSLSATEKAASQPKPKAPAKEDVKPEGDKPDGKKNVFLKG